jgi:hypothetical protein
VASTGSSRTLAWVLGGGGALACTITLVLTISLGLSSEELFLYPTFIATGLLGALVASRSPGNSVGWIMCAAAAAGSLLILPLDYGYAAQVTEHGAWPAGGVALWVAAWIWAPLIGLFLPMLTLRFPDGTVPRRWRACDWLAVAGTAALAMGVALSAPDTLSRFLLSPRDRLPTITALVHNPLAGVSPEWLWGGLLYTGLVLILLAYAMAMASVVDRFRNATGDYRQQLKVFVYAASVIGVVLLVGGITEVSGVVPATGFGVIYHLAFLALPLSIAVAVLRYRLYDIDIIINRTLIYGSLTAILTAVYTAGVAILNRLFIAISGQKSDAAYFLGTFAVVAAFSPVRDWLQRQVNRRVPHDNPATVLDGFRKQVDSVVSVMDVNRVARRFLDQAIEAFDARGADLFLHAYDTTRPTYSRGQVDGEAAMQVELRYEDHEFGRLVLGSRRGGIAYSERDRAVLQQSADSVGEALALAAHLGFQPSARAQQGGKDG